MPGSPFSAFIGGHTRSQSPLANCGVLQNLYVERLPNGSKSDKCFYPTPGMLRFGSVPQVGGKDFFSTAASNSRVFSVTGLKLYEWFSDGSAIERGSVAADANPAVIFTNGDGGQQLGICAGGNFYCYNLTTNVLSQVAFLNGKATMGGFISAYFLVFDIATGTVYQSDLYNGLIFDPLNFFQRNVQADDWNAMFVTSLGRVFLPGTKTRDSYYNAGTFPIPFAPTQSGIQPEGCAATFSVVQCGSRLAWLGTTAEGGYKVYAASGYEATPISTEAIDFALSRFSQNEISQATAESYIDQGHDFFLLYVGNMTFGFDFSTGEWHTRRTLVDAVSGMLGAWRAKHHCFGFNKHLWLDSNTGVAYESDIEFPTDVDGLLIPRERIAPSICKGNQMLDIGDIEILMQTGVGNPNAPGNFPMILLEISTNGGMTFGRQRAASVGREGQFLRVRWQSNGSGRDVAFRVTMSDPITNYRIFMMLVEMWDESGRQVNLQLREAA